MFPQAPVHVVVVFSPERSTADFLKRALDSAGFASFTAPPELARLGTFVQAIHPHAVVIDMTLATETVWEDLARLRNDAVWGDTPIVLTSADESGLRRWMTRSQPGAASVVECFTHARDLRELRKAVGHAVKRPRARVTSARMVS